MRLLHLGDGVLDVVQRCARKASTHRGVTDREMFDDAFDIHLPVSRCSATAEAPAASAKIPPPAAATPATPTAAAPAGGEG